MQFSTLIDEWGLAVLAADLGLPTKNVRSWRVSGSIPADWFVAIERAARRRGKTEITVRYLANIADARRLARAAAEQGAEA